VHDLIGQRVPAVCLKDFNGDPVELAKIVNSWVIYYFYPGTADSPADGQDGPAEDANQHRAFSVHHDALAERGVRTVGESNSTPSSRTESATAC
jgi:peroxiredoxin